MVDQVERGVEHRVDDGGAARRAVGRDRFAFTEHDGRRHAGARPLAWRDVVGAGIAGGRIEGRREVKVGQFIVEQKAVARHHDAATPGLLDGGGVADDVAPPIDDGKVRGVDAFFFLERYRGDVDFFAHAGDVEGQRVAGRGCGHARIQIDQRGARSDVRRIEQAFLGHVHEVFVAHPHRAIGEGQAHRFHHHVHGFGGAEAEALRLVAQRIALQHFQHLDHGKAARGRRAHRGDLIAAVIAGDRLAYLGAVGGEVGELHAALAFIDNNG